MKYELVIRPWTGRNTLSLSELVRYKELFYIFAWRDIKVRYKQTVLGVLWVLFQPSVTTIIFTIFFGKLTKIPSYNMPYVLFVFIGLVFWTFFSATVTGATASLVANEGIIKKVYFPKIILPLSSVFTNSIDFSINLLALFILAAFFGFFPGIWIFVLLPLALILTVTAASGLGLILSAINVKYRDAGYILPFFIQILLFVTPVIYPAAILSPTNRYILSLNPMTTVIELIRWVFSGHGLPDPYMIAISCMSAAVLLLAGLWYFAKTEQFFADLV